jgi:hypothetical protein
MPCHHGRQVCLRTHHVFRYLHHRESRQETSGTACHAGGNPLLERQLGGHVFEAERDVLDRAACIAKREQCHLNTDPAPLLDFKLAQLPWVVPVGRSVHCLAGECPVHEREEALLREDVVFQHVIFRRRLRSEQLPKRLIHEQAVSIRPVHLERNGRVFKQPFEQGSRVGDRSQAIERGPIVPIIIATPSVSTLGQTHYFEPRGQSSVRVS